MEQSKKKSHYLIILKLLFAALPTIVFGVFAIVFTLQQNASAKATREQDQRQADETNQRIVFKEYIDDVKEILSDGHFTDNTSKILLHMRVQTLTVLKYLNTKRKHDIIIFLYENQLIRYKILPTIDLRGADLTDVHFGKSSAETCDLNYLYLPGIYGDNIKFHSCSLAYARFDHALMSNAQFHSCQVSYASFINTNLTNARFYDSQLYHIDLTNALLTKTSVKGGVFQNVNLTNTDLYQSDISDELLYPKNIDAIAPNRFLNTRYPNGSFSEIYAENLVEKTESQCQHNSTIFWKDIITEKILTTIDSAQTGFINKSILRNECFFALDSNQVTGTRVSAQIFSLLIDSELAMFNLSALVALKDPDSNDEISMIVHFSQDEGSFDFSRSAKKPIKSNTAIQFHYLIGKILPKTRFLAISFACNTATHRVQQCLFDRVTMSIFEKNI